jgi:hypothetical protein
MYKPFIGFLIVLILLNKPVLAQSNPDQIFDHSIHTVLVHPIGNPTGIPVIGLDGGSPILISFDDFKASYQNYFYTIELMNENWESVPLSPFDYTRGFSQNKITNFTISSIAIQPYYHYELSLPNENCKPTKSGNYIIKVFKDGNLNDLVFTSRFYVTEGTANVFATVQEPFDGTISQTHQKVQVSVDVKKINYFQPGSLFIQVIQNTRFQDAIKVKEPSFIRGNNVEYNSERDLIFPAGKEFRWLDLQSLRLQTDRIFKFENADQGTKVILKPDLSRANTAYYTFKDLNGNFVISNTESLQSENQNDYAMVQFTYIPKDGIPYMGETLYLSGALTGNILNKESAMQFNAKKGLYEKFILLKQGYYSYQYILRDQNTPQPMQDFMETEGDHWETENNYTILVYYTQAGAQYPSLVGFSTINSKQQW